MSPVHFFSHGSTMMLGEESASAQYWEQMGEEALKNGVKHVVIMGAHWATTFNGILISANPNPGKSPVAYVHPSKYAEYTLNPDLAMVPTLQAHLAAAGIASKPDPTFDWIHDTYLVLIRMFPRGCLPTTILSSQHRYDPHFHLAVGAALRPLRAEHHNTLFIGSGGAVHNLYRNRWAPMLRFRDSFAQETAPEAWAMEFRQEVIDAFVAGHSSAGNGSIEEAAFGKVLRAKGVGGPRLGRKITALMKHPKYREAHATDDHFIASIFVAGLCSGREDEDMRGELGAETWELTNMCNSQFTLGSWDT
ncbi:unnamed protein product [Discula destructiva]